MTATKRANLARMMATETRTAVGSGAVSMPRNKAANAGNRTSTKIMAMSCTISQPTAILPRSVSNRRRSCRIRNTTTVLATESAIPKMSPAPTGQPSHQPTPKPSGAATRPCATAPGTAMARTDSKSFGRK